MNFIPTFPTTLHRDTAELIRDYFIALPGVDTVLVVNSCARSQAVAESDLDFAILVNPNANANAVDIQNMDTAWLTYSAAQPTFLQFKQSSPFAHIHLDIITGNYIPITIELGEPVDYFEVEIGNQVCYSAPMDEAGPYYLELQNKWLPYYNTDLRLERLTRIQNACNYDMDHIPFLIKRGLYFHAFDILYKAFQEYVQALFIANKTYPVAYNKWIKEQVVKWLNKPALYPKLSPILSVNNIESNEINEKAKMLRELLLEVMNQ